MRVLKIAIVEDEQIIAIDLKNYILGLGHLCVGIADCESDALDLIGRERPDLVLMDICIKGESDGIETAEKIMAYDPSIKVIFLTAHTDSYNIDRAILVDPLSYLSKPYNPQELEASIKIAQYKIANESVVKNVSESFWQIDPEFSYDLQSDTLYHYGEMIRLTKKERMLLSLLIRNKNQTVTLYTIENEIWPDKTFNANTVRTLIRRVRPKLKHRFIRTIPTEGYAFIVK